MRIILLKYKIKMMILNKKILIGFSIFSLIAILGLISWNNLSGFTTVKTKSLFVTDLNNDRKLVGISHNVFVAKVIKQVGTKKYGGGNSPQTQFEVKVIKNIKGNIKGNIIVNQEAGYMGNYLVLPEGTSLLEIGNTYLLATRGGKTKTEEVKYAILTHPNGVKLISKDKNISNKKLEATIQNNKRVRELEEAYRNEILFENNNY